MPEKTGIIIYVLLLGVYVIGSILTSVVGFASIVTAVSFASSKGWGSPVVLGLLLFGIIVLAVYAYRQVHIAEPILNLKIDLPC